MTRKELKMAAVTAAAVSLAVVTLVTVPTALALNAKLDSLAQQSTTMEQSSPQRTEPAVTEPVTVELENQTPPNTATDTEPKTEEAKTESIIPDYAAELIGRTIWGEAGGVASKAERAAVAWCILNRVDAKGKTIREIVTAPKQFQGYRDWGDCPQEHIDLAADVLARWEAEKQGAEDVGRVLPADYLYFMGDGERNHFTTEFKGTDYWDWSLTDPYKN